MTDYIKYPKTMHLPWSPGLQNDDRLIERLDGFAGMEVVVTEKMDGENATLYRDHYHARSLDSRHHPSRDWIKGFHGVIRHDIPKNARICGENLYAEHSIHYDNLKSYFYGFSMWMNQYNVPGGICLGWDETVDWFSMLNIDPVPVIWRGPWEEFSAHHEYIDAQVIAEGKEGYVVRICDPFEFDSFQHFVAKFVRKDHIQTDQHWMAKPVVPNGIAK